MKCAKLHLQQRSKGKNKTENSTLVQPRRYCQRRLVNPEHEEDPRWMDVLDRFHCNMKCDAISDVPDTIDSMQAQRELEDLVLTVQTLQFQGDVDQTKRPRTSFKYKKITNGMKHRMFVKQAVIENEFSDDDRSSQLTYYLFEDYMKYLYNNDRSRPSSTKSSVFLKGFNKDKVKENKAIQVEPPSTGETKKYRTAEFRIKDTVKKLPMKNEVRDVSETIENTKITYQKSGKRKSLTISRAQSPETVQVIRVDVVCNYTNSPSPDYEDNKKVECSSDRSEPIVEKVNLKSNYFLNKYNNHFATKYLLTNTIKSLDENLSGGAKVTLLCKTFKLSDRVNTSDRYLGKDKKNTKTLKNGKQVNNMRNKSSLAK